MIETSTTTTTNVLQKPKFMKAAQGKDYGDIEEMISVEESSSNVPYPDLNELFPNAKQRKNFMIIKTHAVALACGDCRVLSGLTKELQGPPSFPYIPCGDCSGVIVEIPDEAKETNNNKNDKDDDYPFKVGDKVCARFVIGPRDALAEYAVVHKGVCAKIPDNNTNVTFTQAAALASACPATLLAERIQPGERVLILGASGGVGSLTSQIMKHIRGASFLAGVSSKPANQLTPLGYDQIIDYTKQNVLDISEFQKQPFDVVVDLAGVGGWLSLVNSANNKTPSIVKPASQGGRYLTLTPDTAIFEAHSIPAVLKIFLWIPLWRAIKSRTWARNYLPKYTFAHSLDQERTHLIRTLDWASKGTIQAVIDPKGPFSFTTAGVRQAFRLQESRHGFGKVVVQTVEEK